VASREQPWVWSKSQLRPPFFGLLFRKKTTKTYGRPHELRNNLWFDEGVYFYKKTLISMNGFKKWYHGKPCGNMEISRKNLWT
jgi:hypothetical protein